MLPYDFSEDLKRDLSRTRTLTLDNNNKVKFVANDPYGFVTIHFSKGSIHKSLTGSFTSFDAAEKAFFNHYKEHKVIARN